jgi:hypothetical protein
MKEENQLKIADFIKEARVTKYFGPCNVRNTCISNWLIANAPNINNIKN